MKRIIEENNLDEVTDLVFDAVEGKKFTTTNALMKVLKDVGFKVSDYVNGEYVVIEYKGGSYIVFTTSKPIEVISVEHDVDVVY